jgi:hypothetical protein
MEKIYFLLEFLKKIIWTKVVFTQAFFGAVLAKMMALVNTLAYYETATFMTEKVLWSSFPRRGIQNT